MKPKVLVQIALMEDGQIGVSSTSNNHITNLGLIGVAQSLFQKSVQNKEKEQSSIIQPSLAVPV